MHTCTHPPSRQRGSKAGRQPTIHAAKPWPTNFPCLLPFFVWTDRHFILHCSVVSVLLCVHHPSRTHRTCTTSPSPHPSLSLSLRLSAFLSPALKQHPSQQDVMASCKQQTVCVCALMDVCVCVFVCGDGHPSIGGSPPRKIHHNKSCRHAPTNHFMAPTRDCVHTIRIVSATASSLAISLCPSLRVM